LILNVYPSGFSQISERIYFIKYSKPCNQKFNHIENCRAR
jgi:hypothetical protein